jgi:hypothetical protein
MVNFMVEESEGSACEGEDKLEAAGYIYIYCQEYVDVARELSP